MLDIKKIKEAIEYIANEKKIPKEELVEVIESAIKTAYKKDFLNKDAELSVKLDLENKNIEIIVEKEVVKEVKNPNTQISFDEL
jgi:N utilization substance protein A